ncbi:MAG: metallophosphoesterase [Fimbriimonadaceae bacterium]|nr:metallophosphoesterase [Fimbriimonadaceae bacterium]
MSLSRRELLTGTAGLAAASTAAAALARPTARRVLRVAHLTDIHVQPERNAQAGFEACLAEVQSLRDAPDLILFGGDNIMDAFRQEADRTKAQWDIFSRVVRNHCRTPHESVIGNHDVWAYGFGDKHKSDPRFGKVWPMEVLGLEKPYRTFDRAGWRFIVLDSTFREGTGYKARLDDEQFEWLKGVLKDTPRRMPILVVSHMPIMCACAMFDGDNEKSGNWQIPGAWMHIDARRIKDAFRGHPNVKGCLSGHIHLIDRVDYNGVSYYCNGAVSAGWWGGYYQECRYGYGLVDLYADGTFTNEYRGYDWKTAKA